MPVAAPAKATRGSDFDPISSSCRNNSRNSYGGVTAARSTRQKNIPRSPNHSKNCVISPLAKSGGDMTWIRGPRTSGPVPATALDSRPITDWNPHLALRDHCSGASDAARSEVRRRRTPELCSRPHIPAWCSYPSEMRPRRYSGRDTTHRRQSMNRHMVPPAQGKKRRGGHLHLAAQTEVKQMHGAAGETHLCTHTGSTTCLPGAPPPAHIASSC